MNRTDVKGKPGESIWVEEVDGQTVYEIDTGEVRQRIFEMDWGVRAPQTVKLMRDLVVIRPDREMATTAAGIYLPGEVRDDAFQRNDYIKSSNQYHTGVVLAVGPGRRSEETGERLSLDVRVGQRVRYHRASSTGLIWTDGLTAVLIHADGGEKIGDAIAWIEEPEEGEVVADVRPQLANAAQKGGGG